jgi:hypothetical protein
VSAGARVWRTVHGIPPPTHPLTHPPGRPRDLKPENILLDDKGNAKISDLGLATHVTPSLAGRCGTRGCESPSPSLSSQGRGDAAAHPHAPTRTIADWAPEMLVKVDGRRQNYSYGVDWWSFGCLLYELLSGKCPFRTEAARSLDPDKHKVSARTPAGVGEGVGECGPRGGGWWAGAQSMDKATLHLEVPYDDRYFSSAAKSLLQGLLTRDPSRRLGARGAGDIKVGTLTRGGGGGLHPCGCVCACVRAGAPLLLAHRLGPARGGPAAGALGARDLHQRGRCASPRHHHHPPRTHHATTHHTPRALQRKT